METDVDKVGLHDCSFFSCLLLFSVMRLLSFVLVMLSFVNTVQAQRKEISQAKSYIKSRSNLDKAESSMRELLKDSVNRRNLKIYVTLAEAVRAQYEQANEKLYLKEKADTAGFFTIARKMFIAFESLDSMDMKPDRNGNVKLRFRKKNSEYLNKYRRNLYAGGIYFMRKGDFSTAYDMLNSYIDCKGQPLFSDYHADNIDSLYSAAAFWATFCGYKSGQPERILEYVDLALTSKKHRRRALIYMSEAYLQKKDTAKYIETLRRGFSENKGSRFFFNRLIDYYNHGNMLDSAMSLVNEALEHDKTNILFLFAKSNLLLNMGKYAECIEISDALLARNDTLPDVYLNAGVSYINMALDLEADAKTRKSSRKTILEYYRKALPYMEKYRAMAPDDKERWAQSLYNIYLKLNMGRKFEEISGILRQMRK